MIDLALGFIGTGGIASAMARGFCSAPEFSGKINLSVHKNREKADALKNAFPGRVSVFDSNQAASDASDVVFVCVLPQQHEAVVRALHFRPNQRVMHITGGVKLADSLPLYAPAKSAARAIPLPFAARRMGPLLFYGGDETLAELMSLIGTLVRVKSERELEILGPVTGMMVPYYALLGESVRWSMEKGLDFRTALDYASIMNETLSSFMRTDCGEDTEAFYTENSTPGGVNELGLKLLRERGFYGDWREVLEKVYERYNSMGKGK
ncbi:NAD(P)-binding domain-containing protein [Cloacibacillus sp. An23]|uniref:NAD(P)-binding domain-containing protein n=1 Tax=Cloacibacillus sp. An23 TaxID=1965591 RepID=UPI000B382394|nr:NAD(P)-binding domain-containing protein [Cloacibacillus sp. An23]OUO95085.1 hypothetical protein B5F39_00705 [Cloacibacillus sp. An23]